MKDDILCQSWSSCGLSRMLALFHSRHRTNPLTLAMLAPPHGGLYISTQYLHIIYLHIYISTQACPPACWGCTPWRPLCPVCLQTSRPASRPSPHTCWQHRQVVQGVLVIQGVMVMMVTVRCLEGTRHDSGQTHRHYRLHQILQEIRLKLRMRLQRVQRYELSRALPLRRAHVQGEGLREEGGDDPTQQVAPEDGRGAQVRLPQGHAHGRLQRPVRRLHTQQEADPLPLHPERRLRQGSKNIFCCSKIFSVAQKYFLSLKNIFCKPKIFSRSTSAPPMCRCTSTTIARTTPFRGRDSSGSAARRIAGRSTACTETRRRHTSTATDPRASSPSRTKPIWVG